MCYVVTMIPQLPNVEVCVLEECPSWEAHKIMQNEIMSLGCLWDCKLTQKMQTPTIAKQYNSVRKLIQANNKVGVVVIQLNGGSSSKFFIYLNATLKLDSPWYWCISGQFIGPQSSQKKPRSCIFQQSRSLNIFFCWVNHGDPLGRHWLEWILQYPFFFYLGMRNFRKFEDFFFWLKDNI